MTSHLMSFLTQYLTLHDSLLTPQVHTEDEESSLDDRVSRPYRVCVY